jgi:hypothetical protein
MRSLLVLSWVLLIAGCSVPMIAVYQTNYPHRIQGPINEEVVNESILEGAKYAGWRAKNQGDSNILATYDIRVHTVVVNINYTIESYSVTYQSSTSMKMTCTQWENNNRKYRVSGENNCPNNQPPVSIHENYKVWVDSLVASINRSLETR